MSKAASLAIIACGILTTSFSLAVNDEKNFHGNICKPRGGEGNAKVVYDPEGLYVEAGVTAFAEVVCPLPRDRSMSSSYKIYMEYFNSSNPNYDLECDLVSMRDDGGSGVVFNWEHLDTTIMNYDGQFTFANVDPHPTNEGSILLTCRLGSQDYIRQFYIIEDGGRDGF